MTTNNTITQQLCDDSDPASYFLNTKLSEQEAHTRFMNQTPIVFQEHQNFMHNVTALPEAKSDKSVTDNIPTERSKTSTPENIIHKATTYSDCVPAINFTFKRNDDKDDDNNANTTKLLDLLVSSQNGSVLATIELNTIIAKMKKAEGEIMDPIDCNNYINDYECNNARLYDPLSITL
jgi:hypothetical protein